MASVRVTLVFVPSGGHTQQGWEGGTESPVGCDPGVSVCGTERDPGLRHMLGCWESGLPTGHVVSGRTRCCYGQHSAAFSWNFGNVKPELSPNGNAWAGTLP